MEEVSPFTLHVELHTESNLSLKIREHWEIPLPHLLRIGDGLPCGIHRHRKIDFNFDGFASFHVASVKRFPILDGGLRFLKLFFESRNQLRMFCGNI